MQTRFSDLSYWRGVNVFSLFASRFQSTSDIDIGEPQSSYDFLASRGIRVIRLAVPWERLQPLAVAWSGSVTRADLEAAINSPLDAIYVSSLQNEIQKIGRAGMKVVIDFHSACRYPSIQRAWPSNPYLRCGDSDAGSRIVGIWDSLSRVFKDNPDVAAYDIVNEADAGLLPGGLSTYEQETQSIVDTIRSNGDTHVIWVQSPVDSAHLLTEITTGPWVKDPLGRITYSQHIYPGHSAVSNQQYSTTVNKPVLALAENFASWCDKWMVHCSIGEVGWPSDLFQAQWPGSAEGWNSVGDDIYDVADEHHMDVTYFAAQSSYSDPLVAYDNSMNGQIVGRAWPLLGIDHAESQSAIIEAHPSK